MRHALLFIGGGVPLSQVVETAQAAESAGLDSVYCVEAYRSAFVPLAAIAGATERVRIGPYILNAYGHSPWITGMSAIDLDELSGGRVVLGVGSGNKSINLDFQGIRSERPASKMREYVELLHTIVRAPLGGPVRYEGEIHRMHWEPRVQPIRDSIPIHLAAVFPSMVQVAGSVADGVGLGVLCSTGYIRDVIRPVAQEAAEAAGRDPAELEFPMAALIAVDDDRERARTAIRAAVCSFFHPIPHTYYEFLLREQGFSDVADACLKFVPEGRPEAAMERMGDALVDTLAFAGTPEDCARRITEYNGLVDEAIYLNVGGADAGTVLEAHRGVIGVKAATTSQ